MDNQYSYSPTICLDHVVLKIGDGDENVIKMILCIANKSLSVVINDKMRIDGFSDVAVTLFRENMEIEIIAFQIKCV